MEMQELQQSYRYQLVKAGVDFHRAEQAAKLLTQKDLQLISEIWLEWSMTFSHADCQNLTSVAKSQVD